MSRCLVLFSIALLVVGHIFPICLTLDNPDYCLQELAYDSGGADQGRTISAGTREKAIGNMLSVRFSPQSESLLIKARFYVYKGGLKEFAPFTVRLFNANRELMPTLANANPTSDGWYNVDLSGFQVEVSSDFFIALEYTSAEALPPMGWVGHPQLGASEGSGDRSYSLFKNQSDGFKWEPISDGNIMIRAVLQTGYPLRVVSLYGETRGSGCYSFGSTATFSVTSPFPVEGHVGLLGGKYVFDRWSGDSIATSPSA
jgi:hypothetical protein